MRLVLVSYLRCVRFFFYEILLGYWISTSSGRKRQTDKTDRQRHTGRQRQRERYRERLRLRQTDRAGAETGARWGGWVGVRQTE